MKGLTESAGAATLIITLGIVPGVASGNVLKNSLPGKSLADGAAGLGPLTTTTPMVEGRHEHRTLLTSDSDSNDLVGSDDALDVNGPVSTSNPFGTKVSTVGRRYGLVEGRGGRSLFNKNLCCFRLGLNCNFV